MSRRIQLAALGAVVTGVAGATTPPADAGPRTPALAPVPTVLRNALAGNGTLAEQMRRIAMTLARERAAQLHRARLLMWPVKGSITAPFCERRAWEACHPGIDIGAPNGTPIHAAAAGKVVKLGWFGGYGNYTCVRHTRALQTCYGHQSAFHTRLGAHVHRGQVIGYVGSTGHSTGNHLHFEVRVHGKPTNPVRRLP